MVQAYRIFAEDLCPYWKDGKEDPYTKPIWTDVQSRLSRELGLASLSSLTYAYQTTWNGNTQTHSGNWSFDKVCETWMLNPFSTNEHIADTYVKERLSFVELAFRQKEALVSMANASYPEALAKAKLADKVRPAGRVYVPGKQADAVQVWNTNLNYVFRTAVDELNTRLRQAGCELDYHNGFIQRSTGCACCQANRGPFLDARRRS